MRLLDDFAVTSEEPRDTSNVLEISGSWATSRSVERCGPLHDGATFRCAERAGMSAEDRGLRDEVRRVAGSG